MALVRNLDWRHPPAEQAMSLYLSRYTYLLTYPAATGVEAEDLNWTGIHQDNFWTVILRQRSWR